MLLFQRSDNPFVVVQELLRGDGGEQDQFAHVPANQRSVDSPSELWQLPSKPRDQLFRYDSLDYPFLAGPERIDDHNGQFALIHNQPASVSPGSSDALGLLVTRNSDGSRSSMTRSERRDFKLPGKIHGTGPASASSCALVITALGALNAGITYLPIRVIVRLISS